MVVRQGRRGDSARRGANGVPDSMTRINPISGLFARIMLVVGVIGLSPPALSGAERDHPSLVDPVITKCAVCHTGLATAHPEGAPGEDCLSCHTMIQKSGKTYLIVESAQTPANSAPTPVMTEGRVASAHRTPDATVAQETSPPEEPNPAVVGGGASAAGDLYSEGMAAFNREEYDLAFHTWWSMLTGSPDHFTLQVEVDTLFVSAQSTVVRYGDHSLYVIKKDDLHWVLSGLYHTQAQATEALQLLPEPLRRGGAFPVAVRQILSPQ